MPRNISKPRLYGKRAIALMQSSVAAVLPRQQATTYRARIRRDVFTRILNERRWGNACVSGPGSTVEYTRGLRTVLRRVVGECEAASMLDAGCGAFEWMPLVLEELPVNFRYVGVDIVPDLIDKHSREHPRHEFRVVDFVCGDFARCDLIFCRDVLQHLPIADAITVLQNFSRSGARHLLTSTDPRRHGWRNRHDRRVGSCANRNLLVAPFDLADPVAIYGERDVDHKFLGLWELPLRRADGRPLGVTNAEG